MGSLGIAREGEALVVMPRAESGKRRHEEGPGCLPGRW